MKNLPDFLIIGPPKCASTSLHYYLAQHPDVFMSPVKETNFFTHDYYKGLSFYETYFSDAGSAKAIGEATPSYAFLPFALDRIRADLPGVKLITILRNPVERAFSHWLMFKESGMEKTSFREAININLRQMEYADFEGEKGAALWDERKRTAGDINAWPRTYIQPGMYAANLNMVYKRFDRKQVHIIFLEDLKYHFQDTIKELFGFIGVDGNVPVANTESKNYYFNKKYLRLMQKIVGIKYARYISGKISPGVKNIFKQPQKAVKNIPSISMDDRLFLENIFSSDIKKLEEMTKKNLQSWITRADKTIIHDKTPA